MASSCDEEEVSTRSITMRDPLDPRARKAVFEDLQILLRRDEIPDAAIRGIPRLLPLTLARFNDNKSRALVEVLVVTLARRCPDMAFGPLALAFHGMSQSTCNVHATVHLSRTYLTALRWLCSMVRETARLINVVDKDEFGKVVEAMGLLLGEILAADSPFHIKKALRQLSFTWLQVPKILDGFAKVLSQTIPTYQTVLLSSYIIKHLHETKNLQGIDKFKGIFLDGFIKAVISIKVKPPLHVLEFSASGLRYVTHSEFQGLLLPAMQRALLRNPELILEGVSKVLAFLTLDMSQYAFEIGKTLGTYLYSKEDTIRQSAGKAIKCLARQSSELEVIKQILYHFVAIINGSEGKLTLTAQRVSILYGIGNLSYNTASGPSGEVLAQLAANELLKILKSEVHEGTLVCGLAMLALWCARFNTEVPPQLVDFFQEGVGAKSTNSAVRYAYFNLMNVAFHGDVIGQGRTLVQALLKAVEKSAGQSSQTAAVAEAILAALLLLKLNVSIPTLDSSLTAMWNVLLDFEKQVYVSEKFLLSASEEVLGHLVMLIERLCLDFPEKLTSLGPYRRAIIFVLLRPSYKLRRLTSSAVKRMTLSSGGGHLVVELLRELSNFLHDKRMKVFVSDSSSLSEQNNVGTSIQPADTSMSINACYAIECLDLLCSGDNLGTVEREAIAFESIVGAHHPVIVSVQFDLWVCLVRRLDVDPFSLIRKNLDHIWATILECSPLTPTYHNVVGTVVRICPDGAFALIIPHVKKELTSSEVSNVTNVDYGIFLTPPEELHDKSVIQSGREEAAESKNIKRESKLYSFKEQMEEIELKKELEAKKKAALGLKAEPELNPKQLEIMKSQLAKEAAIRERIRLLHLRTTQAMAIASAATQGNPAAACIYCRDIVEGLKVALRSPITAFQAMSLFIELHSCVLPHKLHSFGLLICHVTLRLLEPCCELDGAWNQENLVNAATRTIRVLHSMTVRATGDEYDEIKESIREPLTAPAFAYAFPLINLVLRNGGQRVNFHESTLIKGLEVIVEHAQMRTIPGVPNQELINPAFLPRQQMMDLLIHLIEITSGEIQNLSGRVLLQAAESASGRPGCATASSEEVRSVLLALQSPVVVVRHFALLTLTALTNILKAFSVKSKEPPILRRLWVSRFDPDENNRELTDKLWISVGLRETTELCRDLLSDIAHPEGFVREAAAEALASLLGHFPKQINPILDSLLKMYKAGSKTPPPVLDNFGRVVAQKPIDEWEGRSGVALALRNMASKLPESAVSNLMNFFFEALRDTNARVQHEMLEAALEIVNVHGKNNVAMLLKLFQNFLTKTPKSSKYDTVRQSVVILMGSLARHLDANDPQVRPIVTRLIDTLSTPSQQVQEAVANCLPPLVTSLRDEAPELVRQLLQKLVGTGSYGERRGAAYGISGLVKGLGILSLKQLGVMDTLNEAISDKKRYQAREGALLAFEMLCHMLGRLFEPYVVHILPTMLICFGDSNHYVREAAEETAKTVMGQLSVHGVKMVLPVLMRGLEDDSWRTKAGSIELLGAMAFCAPKQLGSCLPSIVPRLIEVLSDSHVKVQEAGAQALKQIGSVIRNPEIQALVSILLEALQDPSRKTSLCLQTLLDTKFVHFIDAPSLALIMPVVQRAFQDRSTETRKMAAQIIGNMYSVTDKKDLAPYLPNVIPGLKQSLLDPVPEVRSVAARALGAMVKGMGEGIYDELLPWLMQTLTSEASSVDRSGAAQGLSEVVGGRGVEKLHKLMPDIIATADRSDVAPHVKDGYIMTFIFMPVVFQREFTPYIGQIINPILKALADESEFVRETAFRAGQRIVNMYAESAIALLLPELEQGLFDDNWRIRYSSVQLLGDLLYKISGVSGKMTTETADEDDNFGTEHSHKAIMGALGRERRNRVLAGLYMGRSDIALMVRQSALHVWKIVVTNTPRTLREILPTLFTLLLGCLASTSYDKRQVAARTLGDLVRKLGERVLPDIIPILELGLDSDRADQRQGVCIGLSEIMASTSREMVMTFVDSLVPTVRRALCDPLPEVRQAAAKTFDSLHNTVGHRALDDILSPLLKQLGTSEVGEYALDGLRQVMAIKSKVVLPYLIPQLTSPPINTKALSILASVAGDALTKHLGKVLPALLVALSQSRNDTPNEQQELEYCEAVILSVSGPLGVHMVIDELLEATRNGSVGVRRAATMLLYSYCSQSKADYSPHVPQLLRGLVHLFIDSDERVLRFAWEALNAVTKDLDANEQLQHVANVRQAVRFTVSDLGPNQLLPGFCLPKGIASILPIFREAILNGTAELKEQAAIGLGEVIQLTNAEALKPSVVNITGPLIRVLGDRFAWNVRVAVLDTLTLLLSKVGAMLKPFLPQLQTTFLKALSDSNRQVRLKAAAALSHLIVIHTKADPLFTELHTNVRNADDPSIRETMLHALRSVVTPAGDKMSDTVRRAVLVTLQQPSMLGAPEDTTRSVAAGCIGALCRTLPEDELRDIVNAVLLPTDNGVSMEWEMRHGCSVAMMVALDQAPNRIVTSEWTEQIIKVQMSYITTDKIPIVLSGIRGVGLFLKHQLFSESTQWPVGLIQVFSKLMNHNSNEVKQLVAQVGSFLSHSVPKGELLPDALVRPLIPMLVNGTKEKNTAVKANSEFALVAILKLRTTSEEAQQRYSKLLDAGAKEALADVIAKVLWKVANQPEPKEETLDDTLLT